MKLKVTVNAVPYEVEVEVAPPELALPAITIGGGSGPAIAVAAPKAGGSAAPASANAIPAPLAGTVTRILVEKGQEVAEGDVVLILEAMKMETEITSPRAGKVSAILVAPGDPVQGGQGLVEVE